MPNDENGESSKSQTPRSYSRKNSLQNTEDKFDIDPNQPRTSKLPDQIQNKEETQNRQKDHREYFESDKNEEDDEEEEVDYEPDDTIQSEMNLNQQILSHYQAFMNQEIEYFTKAKQERDRMKELYAKFKPKSNPSENVPPEKLNADEQGEAYVENASDQIVHQDNEKKSDSSTAARKRSNSFK